MEYRGIGGFMKMLFTLVLTLSLSAFAANRYGVYDAQGNRVFYFDAELHELPEKAKQLKNANLQKNLYISSYLKTNGSKPSSRYRYKAEIGAYIEAKRKETFSICPNKNIDGVWISKHSVALDEKNCLSVKTPDLAGTVNVLFLQNNGKTDTIQVLVEQSYIPMGDYSHKIWVVDTNSRDYRYATPHGGLNGRVVQPGNYESRTYNQNLIVDKTKLILADATRYIYKFDKKYNVDSVKYKRAINLRRERIYSKNTDIKKSTLPYAETFYLEIANERSKEEGLDTVYIDLRNNDIKNYKNAIPLGRDIVHYAMDTSAFGYRLPFNDEWFYLMRAGASTRYYWGDEEDSLTVSKYAWISPMGLKPVAQLEPNRFGLYDMVGMAKEEVMAYKFYESTYAYYDFIASPCYFSIGGMVPECAFMLETQSLEKYMDRPLPGNKCKMSKDDTEFKCIKINTTPKLEKRKTEYSTIRLLRKTPKLNKLEKF